MKCIQNKKTKQIIRVTDEQASELVDGVTWAYTSKSEWKRLSVMRGKNET